MSFLKYKKAKIPIDQLDQIIEYIDNLDLKWENSGFGENTFDKNYRLSQHVWVKDEFVKEFVGTQFESANSDPEWWFDLNGLEDIQYTKYDGTGGHYNWHNDEVIDSESRVCRKLSTTIMLSNSDEYEGGEFQFRSLGRGNVEYETITLEKGDFLMFPSLLNHRVKPVLKGTRKVLVSWAWGPLFR